MRVLAVLLIAALLAACSSEPPHSNYYIVSFDANSADLNSAARGIVERAVKDAKSDLPHAVTVKGYIAADSIDPALSEQRMRTVQQALASGGIAGSLIKLAPSKVDASTYARLGDGVVVQLERGEVTAPPKPVEEE